ncbi:hypothetical protein NE237_012643 [Protea cynaroides]|uniref:DAGKc domain-containing protein n=1 Tax=Protea cynaroides TaxID=273540 RepID=A0A9Q0GYG2_9MAGN|nr:hypothetical protein NE237_012643 [Protea cynaroides]
MRIGSNYAIRGGQAASRIAELEARVQELSSQVERSVQTAKQLEDMTARAAQLQEELATVTATSAKRERALQAEPSEQHPAGDHWTFISGLGSKGNAKNCQIFEKKSSSCSGVYLLFLNVGLLLTRFPILYAVAMQFSRDKKYPVEGAGTRGSPLEGVKVGRKAERRTSPSDSHKLAKVKNGTALLTDTNFRNGISFLTSRERWLLTELALVIDPIQAQDNLQVLVALLKFGKISCSSRFFVLFLWNQLAISFCGTKGPLSVHKEEVIRGCSTPFTYGNVRENEVQISPKSVNSNLDSCAGFSAGGNLSVWHMGSVVKDVGEGSRALPSNGSAGVGCEFGDQISELDPVRFPALQLYLWGVSFLGRLASLVGQSMFTDKLTADRRMLSYARVCFEVTADSELPDEVWYEKDDGTLTAQRVEYYWKPTICTSCKSFAHSSASCLVRKLALLGNQSTDALPELLSALTDEIVEGVQHMGAPEGEWNRVVGRKTKLAAESVLGGSTQGARQNVCDNSTITPSQMEPEGCMAIVPCTLKGSVEAQVQLPYQLSSSPGCTILLGFVFCSFRHPLYSLHEVHFSILYGSSFLLRCSQVATGQQSSPTVFPEKRSKLKALRRSEANVVNGDPEKVKTQEHRIDIGDEKSDLLGYIVFSGKLVLDRRMTNSSSDVQLSTEITDKDVVDAKLTSNALVWGSNMLCVEDVISVTYSTGLRHFTVHAYPIRKRSYGLSCFMKPQRSQKDFRFLASSSEEALQWVSGLADQQCFVNCLPHPLVSSKKQASNMVASDFPPEPNIKCKSPPKVLVILNPRSGRGRSSKLFHGKVEPVFKLAGFKMEVVKTTYAGHARHLALTIDFRTCPDGIICVGGDGIVNEVLNGLLSRSNQKEAISIPIGIIPAGSDNSLVWTVLGVQDPVSAAIAIVKGGLTATDVFAVEWIQTGAIHFGMTVSYYGFVSDVLELSEKYQKRFGPLRYFVAGFFKFLCLPKYTFEVEYLPAAKEVSDLDGKVSDDHDTVDISDLYTDIMRRSNAEGIPRASSLSSIDSLMTPSRMSGDLDAPGSTHASTESSEYIRGLDPKSKRLSSGRSNATAEPEEVLHPQLPLSATPNWPRTRSKSRTDKGWIGLTATHDPTRCSWGNPSTNDKEDISSTMSDPGPIWDTEPKWDTEPNWDVENPIELPGPSGDVDEPGIKKEITPRNEDKWVHKKGQFLGVLVCNHACKTVQTVQVVAPKAEHDDKNLDLLLVHGSGRLRLLRFFLRLQLGRHLSLPYVEYVKVKSVKIKPCKNTHNGCGIDGELLSVNGQVISSLLPEQCRLIGRAPSTHI